MYVTSYYSHDKCSTVKMHKKGETNFSSINFHYCILSLKLGE